MDWCLWLSILSSFTLTPRLRPLFSFIHSCLLFFSFLLLSVSASDSGDQPRHTHSIPYHNYSQWDTSILLHLLADHVAHFLHYSLLDQGSGFYLGPNFLFFLSCLALSIFFPRYSLQLLFFLLRPSGYKGRGSPFSFPISFCRFFFSNLSVNQHDCNDTCAESNVAIAIGDSLFAFISALVMACKYAVRMAISKY